jgi:predicted GTPase
VTKITPKKTTFGPGQDTKECSVTKRILVLGTAGRNFHNFNVVFRDKPEYEVVGFTATRFRGLPITVSKELAGLLYQSGCPIFDEKDLEKLIRGVSVDTALFSYSDISHQNLMHLALPALTAGADFCSGWDLYCRSALSGL